MALNYLPRTARIIWYGDPFAGLKQFTIRINTRLDAGPGGDPQQSYEYADHDSEYQAVVDCNYGTVGIEQGGNGSIWIGAGPKVVEGEDGNDYTVSMYSWNNPIAHDTQVEVIEVSWSVTGVA